MFNRFVVLTLVTLLALSACAGPGSNQLVAFSTFAGSGDARTDTRAFLVIGDADGEAGIFMKGSGFPLTFPFQVAKGGFVALNRDTGERLEGQLADGLPHWTESLFRPGELEQLSARLGVDLFFNKSLPQLLDSAQ